jgi:hypothetical protein
LLGRRGRLNESGKIGEERKEMTVRSLVTRKKTEKSVD